MAMFLKFCNANSRCWCSRISSSYSLVLMMTALPSSSHCKHMHLEAWRGRGTSFYYPILIVFILSMGTHTIHRFYKLLQCNRKTLERVYKTSEKTTKNKHVITKKPENTRYSFKRFHTQLLYPLFL